MIKERARVADDPEVQQILEEQLTQERQAHQAELDRKDDIIKRQDQKIKQQDAYEKKVHEIVTNTNMSYSDRVLWIVTLKNHPNEILTLKAFQPNVSRLRQESGVGIDTATKFFASMEEAKAIKYSNKSQQDEAHHYTSVSTIVPLAEHSQANTKAAATRIKQREEVAKRRIARKLHMVPCEQCGESDLDQALAAIVQVCNTCKHPSSQVETVLAKNVRIIEEQIIPPTAANPTHEFSDDDEYENEENTVGQSSHEFSDDLAARSTETPGNQENASDQQDETPSHDFSDPISQEPPEPQAPSHDFSDPQTKVATSEGEFSVGMKVMTTSGIGTISNIASIYGHDMRCNVKFTSLQPNGTYYNGFSLAELESVSQTAFL